MNETEVRMRIKFFFLLTFNMFPEKQRGKRDVNDPEIRVYKMN